MTDITSNVNALISDIISDYGKQTKSSDPSLFDHIAKMNKEFAEKITFTVGKKYIRIVNGSGGVWGFIVNTADDKKFNLGDILMAAGWKTPARNSSRGNVVDGDYSISWTGPGYLRR